MNTFAHLNITRGRVILVTLDGVSHDLPFAVDGVAPGTCSFNQLDLSVTSDNRMYGAPGITCNIDGHQIGELYVGGWMFDARTFGVGQWTYTELGAGMGWNACAEEETLNFPAAGAGIDVSEATGGIADYPQAVTPDFFRRFSVAADTGSVADCNAVMSGCPICSRIVRMSFVATFDQRASDYRRTPCPCQ